MLLLRKGFEKMTEYTCCLCGETITQISYALRDYKNETYPQWIWRHILTVLTLRAHKEDGSMPVCDLCYLKALKRNLND